MQNQNKQDQKTKTNYSKAHPILERRIKEIRCNDQTALICRLIKVFTCPKVLYANSLLFIEKKKTKARETTQSTRDTTWESNKHTLNSIHKRAKRPAPPRRRSQIHKEHVPTSHVSAHLYNLQYVVVVSHSS